MRSLVKYRGGKSRELPEFRQYIPNEYERYIESFLGGGAVSFDLEPEHEIVNDINAKLMNFYSEVRNNYDEIAAELGHFS